MHIPKFSTADVSLHMELKKRVNNYFKETGKHSTGNFQLFFKAAILIVSFLAIYIHLIFFTPPALLGIIECIVLGGLTAAIGFNVMHDGAHGSFSRHKRINEYAGITVNFLGASNFMWKTKHNVIHHAYTNIDGVDDDIDARPFLRLCETQKKYRIHKYQYLYFWLAYSLLYFWWVFASDYKKYFSGHIGPVPIKKMHWKDHISFWVYKAIHLFLFIGLPIYMVGFEYWLVGFLIHGLVTGFVLSIVFQLAHTVQETIFPHADENSGRLEDEWAIHQLKTTANFATKNKLVSWFTGGLNFQIEHHLFPKISHVHYPAISKIVKQACQEFGVNYIEHRRVRYAVASHVAYLRQMGKN